MQLYSSMCTGVKCLNRIIHLFPVIRLDVVWFGFVASLPYLAEDHRRMETIENSQGHAHVHNDDPRPETVKL